MYCLFSPDFWYIRFKIREGKTMLKFICPLIVVNDMAVSRHFYEDILGLKVLYDLGQNVTFEGNFALHLKSHFQTYWETKRNTPLPVAAIKTPVNCISRMMRLRRISETAPGGCRIHPCDREQPWGQRVIRLYDPDGHIIEIGESMEAVVRRLHAQGQPVEAISARTLMPPDFVRQAIGE
jgi:catechol 2,3-dioxygenase-like lactoylglutathione lyase family enzyme